MARKILYLGLELPKNKFHGHIIHFPVIQTVPRPHNSPGVKEALDKLQEFTHIVFTSKTTVRIFQDFMEKYGYNLNDIQDKKMIAVGGATSAEIQLCGWKTHHVAEEETSEGIIEMLKKIDLSQAHLFWPHSALSRRIIPGFLQQGNISFYECVFYDTKIRREAPSFNLADIDEIVFTSPSTVDAFLDIFGSVPQDKTLTSLGPVTKQYLQCKTGVF